jgi:hypothetical protein
VHVKQCAVHSAALFTRSLRSHCSGFKKALTELSVAEERYSGKPCSQQPHAHEIGHCTRQRTSGVHWLNSPIPKRAAEAQCASRRESLQASAHHVLQLNLWSTVIGAARIRYHPMQKCQTHHRAGQQPTDQRRFRAPDPHLATLRPAHGTNGGYKSHSFCVL